MSENQIRRYNGVRNNFKFIYFKRNNFKFVCLFNFFGFRELMVELGANREGDGQTEIKPQTLFFSYLFPII